VPKTVYFLSALFLEEKHRKRLLHCPGKRDIYLTHYRRDLEEELEKRGREMYSIKVNGARIMGVYNIEEMPDSELNSLPCFSFNEFLEYIRLNNIAEKLNQ